MVNVLLTTGCNLSCTYCFAQEKMGRMQRQHMSIANVRKVIDFLKRSDFGLFRTMGGEPTLHPDYPEIATLALDEGMRVDVLSNATWQDDCANFFTRVPPGRICFLLNIDHPENYSPKQWSRIQRNLDGLPDHKNVTLSFNIFEKQPRYDYIFDLTQAHDISMVRLSFSLPVLGIQNTYLDIEEYKAMSPFILEFVREAEGRGVSVQIDNAVPFCIFTQDEMGKLLVDGVLDLQRNARCDPVIDIGPDLTVWCCFCLSKLYNRKLDEFDDLTQLKDYYRRMLREYQSRLVPFDECVDCKYRKLWACQGGCITYSINRFSDRLPGGLIPETDQIHAEENRILALSSDVKIAEYTLPDECYVLTQAASGVEIEIEKATFEPILPLLDGKHTVDEVRDRLLHADEDNQEHDAASEFILRVKGESVDGLLTGLLRRGFLVQH